MLRALRRFPEDAERVTREYFAAGTTRRILWRLGANLIAHGATRTASAMAFDLFLAFVPMLALAGWVLAHVIRVNEVALTSSSVLFQVTPNQMHELLARHFARFEGMSLAPLATISGWWLASSAFHTLICVYEDAFKIDPRAWWWTRLIALGCALLAICGLSLSGAIGLLMAGAAGNPVVGVLLRPVDALGLAKWIGIVVALVVATLFFSVLFLVSVRRKRSIRRHVVPGAAIAVVLGAVSTAAFSYYATQLGRFALFYGGLAAVAITMAWLWLWCLATLLGAEVNLLIENIDRDRELALASSLYIDGPNSER
jgi:YihY family inner membrane protein